MKKLVIATLAAAVALGVWWAVAEGPLRSPQQALQDFYEARDRAEDQLADPLILNGRRVVPLVIAAVQDKEMKHRRYAIGFLGNGRYREALPILERILGDETEIDYFRADALEAIFQIDPDRAREVAPAHLNGESLLGRVAGEIQAGRNPVPFTRTYWQAFRHVHD